MEKESEKPYVDQWSNRGVCGGHNQQGESLWFLWENFCEQFTVWIKEKVKNHSNSDCLYYKSLKYIRIQVSFWWYSHRKSNDNDDDNVPTSKIEIQKYIISTTENFLNWKLMIFVVVFFGCRLEKRHTHALTLTNMKLNSWSALCGSFLSVFI